MDRFISVNQAYDTLKNMTCSTTEYTFAKEVINNTPSVEAIAKEDIITSKEKIEDPKLKESLLNQKILKAILLLRKCGNKASTKDEQIAEQKRWLKEGYTNEKSLDEWIQSLKEELAKTPEQKEKESQEFIEQLMAYEAKEALKELEEGRRTRSSSAGDYSPSNPWDAPGMSVSDFISVNSFGGHRL